VLRRIFGHKREDVVGRKLYNDKLNNFYPSQNIIMLITSRNMRWAGHAAHEMRKTYKILVRNPERNKPLGRIILR
jgi:hypothetical protein